MDWYEVTLLFKCAVTLIVMRDYSYYTNGKDRLLTCKWVNVRTRCEVTEIEKVSSGQVLVRIVAMYNSVTVMFNIDRWINLRLS